MEPQINYGGSSFQNHSKQKVYGRSRSGGKGCFGIIGGIILLLLIILGAIYFAYPALTPNKIHGDFMDMAIVPQKDGSVRLWILTDGSFNFIQTTKSPGSYSTGRKCYFCKTWTYVYDPVSEKVLNKIKTEQNDIILRSDVVYNKGKVWVIADGYNENEPKILIYNAETSEQIMDTKGFLSQYTILSAGLSGLRYDEKQNIITFNTKDGREQVTYSMRDDKMYSDQAEFYKAAISDPTPSTIAVLGPESSGSKRKILYKLSGPKNQLDARRSSLESSPYNGNEKTEGYSVEPFPDKTYLEGLMYYQDKDCAIVIYLDQTGNKSNRIMTCFDIASGKEKWTVTQDNLFDRMKINTDKDSFSDLFFTKDKIKVRRSGNLVVLQLKGEGVMGFDYNTGKQLWVMNI